MITQEDRALLAQKGISEEKLNTQLECFAKGFPFLQLDAAASVNNGILKPDAEAEAAFQANWEAYTTDATHRIVKFDSRLGSCQPHVQRFVCLC